MKRSELQELFSKDEVENVYLSVLDNVILSNFNNNEFSAEVLNVYTKFIETKDEAPEEIKANLFKTIRNFALSLCQNNNLTESLLMFRLLFVKNAATLQDYPEIAVILAKLGDLDGAFFYMDYYEKEEQNLPLKYITLANFYNLQIKDLKSAIKYYEKYIEIDETKAVIYNILANLYSKVYGKDKLEEQIAYYQKAFKIKNDDKLALHGLAFCYEEIQNYELADKFYRLIIQNEPSNTDFYNYGHFLIHCGDLLKGHKYFLKRNLIDNEPFNFSITKTQEDLDKLDSDLSSKTVLVHYEQGFGDTIMYCRFLPLLKTKVKKLIFVVQDELLSLIKQSKIIADGINIIGEKEYKLENPHYDVGIMLLDVPYVLKIDKDNIPYSQGYLEVEQEQINSYAKQYLPKNQNKKIGISYSGDKFANYEQRDINWSKFNIIAGLERVEIYSLQKDNCEDNFIPLGKTFDNFIKTACAIKSMDLIISTDNVILNLAGALGVKTLGLFNEQTNFRWFNLKGHDTVWYKSVEPIHIEKPDAWNDLIDKIK